VPARNYKLKHECRNGKERSDIWTKTEARQLHSDLLLPIDNYTKPIPERLDCALHVTENLASRVGASIMPIALLAMYKNRGSVR
jgi:hypothetical protein